MREVNPLFNSEEQENELQIISGDSVHSVLISISAFTFSHSVSVSVLRSEQAYRHSSFALFFGKCILNVVVFKDLEFGVLFYASVIVIVILCTCIA